QAEVVLLHCLLLAPLAELADGAMVVEDQPGRHFGGLHLMEFFQEALGLAQVRVEAYSGGPALLAVPDDAAARCPSLESGDEEAVHVQLGTLLLADLLALGEQHGDVMEVPQLRGARRPLQTVAGERNVLVFQGGVKNEGRPALQGTRGEEEVVLDSLSLMTGENPVGGSTLHFVARLGEEYFVLRLDPLLFGQLEVPLVLAVQVGLDGFPRDLGCHDAPSEAIERDLLATMVHERRRRDHRTCPEFSARSRWRLGPCGRKLGERELMAIPRLLS